MEVTIIVMFLLLLVIVMRWVEVESMLWPVDLGKLQGILQCPDLLRLCRCILVPMGIPM